MATKNHFIFQILHVIAWVIFVGLCIEAGGLLVNFAFSIYNPDIIPRLYNTLDLSEMYDRSKWAFYGMYTFMILISLLKAYMFYIVARLMLKMKLSDPFSSFVSRQITSIAYCTFSVGLISLIGRSTARNLQHHGYVTENLNTFLAGGEAFILMAAVIYVIATIFKKGVELQHENDLTI